MAILSIHTWERKAEREPEMAEGKEMWHLLAVEVEEGL